jgi:hypothetical protein
MAREGNPLALVPEIAPACVSEFLQRRHLNDSIDTPLDIRSGQLLHSQAKGNVLVDREVRKERVALKDLIYAAHAIEGNILPPIKTSPVEGYQSR